MTQLPHRTLGASELSVSLLSLGSWRTYERMPDHEAKAVMSAGRDAGITFLDDARYNDETGTAPLASGWSEVRFGELFRAVGWPRDEVVVANKLWWEFWPEQDPAAELDASLERMRFDHVDVIYSMTPPDTVATADIVTAMDHLVTSGRARAWAVANWSASQTAEAVALCRQGGLAEPCTAQLPYSLVRRAWVDDNKMAAVLDDDGMSLVASYVLAGGILSGKYLRGQRGRASDSELGRPGEVAADLDALATEWGIPAAQLAFAFALDHPQLASVLFGATSVAQLEMNVAALDVHARLDADQLARLRAVGDDKPTAD